MIPSFYHNSNLYNKCGKLIRNDISHHKGSKLSSYSSRHPLTKNELFLLLYVDDGAIMFTNRQDTILRSRIAFLQMKRIVLNMHIAIDDKQSKTEAVFFPSRETIQIWIEEYQKSSLPPSNLPIIDPDAPKKGVPLKKNESCHK